VQSIASSAIAPVCRRGVVAVVVRSDAFLVVRRSAGVAAPGRFCFPGGGIEANETEQQAIVREFWEELGTVLRPRRRIWRCQTAWQVDLAWWLGEIDQAANLSPNPAEVESLHWLNARDLEQLAGLLDSNREFLRRVAAGSVPLGERSILTPFPINEVPQE
jgi:8-oxo-dGTP pyrophosphatase MutT (NUDIX family)